MPVLPKPAAVKWLLGLAIARLVAACGRSLLAIYFITPGASPFAQGIRTGFLRASGLSPDEYGERQAGGIIGGTIAASLFTILLLVFLHRRSLIGVRVMAVLLVLEALASPLALPIVLAIAVLAFTRSTREYCRASDAVAGAVPAAE